MFFNMVVRKKKILEALLNFKYNSESGSRVSGNAGVLSEGLSGISSDIAVNGLVMLNTESEGSRG